MKLSCNVRDGSILDDRITLCHMGQWGPPKKEAAASSVQHGCNGNCSSAAKLADVLPQCLSST